MWPSAAPLQCWAVVTAHPSAMLCWLKVVAHPLFRKAIRGHWHLSEVRRTDVADHLAEITQHVDPRKPAPEVLAYRDSLSAAKSTWSFRIENDWFAGRPGRGLRHAIKGEVYEFIFDAATT